MEIDHRKRDRIRLFVIAGAAFFLVVLVVLLAVFVIRPGDSRQDVSEEAGITVQGESQEEEKSRHHVHRSSGSKKIANPTEEDVEEFWANSSFFGDSIMKGYGAFLDGEAKGALSSPSVTALVGYDLETALLPVDAADHPLYNGEKHTIFEVLPQENPEKVVLSFGINDLGKNSVPQIVENYDTVIQKVRELCPEADIYVVSCTYVFSGRESGNRTNENVRRLNSLMTEYCEENEIGFIDVASYMAADDGSLYSGYTADFYVHLNNNAYRTWLQVFRRYAYEALSGKEAPEDMYPITRPAPAEKPAYVPVSTEETTETETETESSAAETETVETAPTESTSVQPTPTETAPIETTSAETKPSEILPPVSTEETEPVTEASASMPEQNEEEAAEGAPSGEFTD